MRAGERARGHRPERRGQVDARADPRRDCSRPRPASCVAEPALATADAGRPRSAGARGSCSPASARSSRTPSTSSSRGTVREELEVGPRALGLGDGADRGAGRRAARPAAPRPARRGEPVHALGRGEAAAHGRGGARDAAPRAGARRADVRSGRAHVGRARRDCSRDSATGWTVTSGSAIVAITARPGRRAGPARRRCASSWRRRMTLLDSRAAHRSRRALEPRREARRRARSSPCRSCSRWTGCRPRSRSCWSACSSRSRASDGGSSGCGRGRCGSPHRSPALTIALYGQTSGEVYVDWFLVQISEGSLELALATLLRVLAIALPSVVLFVTVDPTDLADGLGAGAAAARPVRARRARRAADGRALHRRLARARARAPRARGRRPRAHPALPRDGVRAARAVDPAGIEARDRDGGARLRRAGPAHLGAGVDVRLAANGC